MPFDYKKEYKEFYLPPKTPGIITVPAMNFLAVRGQGDPNEEDSAYKQAIGMLYAVAFTIAAMEECAKAQGYEADFGEGWFHHEIYLSDVRRCKPEQLKTGTQLTCTETVAGKHWGMRPFVPGYLKRQQKLYLNDLQKELLK